MIYLGQDAIGLNHMIGNIGEVAIIESGTYTPIEDEDISAIFIPHSLGTIPDFLVCDSNTTNLIQSENYLIFCYAMKSSILPTMGDYDCLTYGGYTKNNSTTGVLTSNKIRLITPVFSDENHDASKVFRFVNTSAESAKLKAGVTYHYVIGKFNEQEVTSNA